MRISIFKKVGPRATARPRRRERKFFWGKQEKISPGSSDGAAEQHGLVWCKQRPAARRRATLNFHRFRRDKLVSGQSARFRGRRHKARAQAAPGSGTGRVLIASQRTLPFFQVWRAIRGGARSGGSSLRIKSAGATGVRCGKPGPARGAREEGRKEDGVLLERGAACVWGRRSVFVGADVLPARDFFPSFAAGKFLCWV
jgi:hypothetical protein